MIAIRKLAAADVEAYKELRLRALRESSRAFSDSFEDEGDRPLAFFESCIGASAEHLTIAGFVAHGTSAGAATFKRDQRSRSKARHKAFIRTM